MVQLREKDLGARALCALARQLLAVTRPGGCPLLINGRIDVALAVDADGVHLPEAGIPVTEARRLLGPKKLVGVSTHSASSAVRAGEQGADYVVCGPVWDTPSKRGLGSPIGIDALAQAAAQAGCPVLAIGGITDQRRARDAMAAGASGVAVIRAVMGAADAAAATATLCRALGS
jgi:thiamine-phosphate pyrophosphorylase